MDTLVALAVLWGAFIFGMAAGWAAGRHVGKGEAGYWARRARELERREETLMKTILELRRAGNELPPEEPPYEAPYIITDEFSARVHEERTGRTQLHEELVRQVVEDED